MDPRENYFGLGQALEDVPLPPAMPECARRPGAVVMVNAQGQAICVNPEFLPEDKKQVPPCPAGHVPVLDTRVTTGSGWSCVATGAPVSSGSGGRSSGALVAGAVVLLLIGGAAVFFLRR